MLFSFTTFISIITLNESVLNIVYLRPGCLRRGSNIGFYIPPPVTIFDSILPHSECLAHSRLVRVAVLHVPIWFLNYPASRQSNWANPTPDKVVFSCMPPWRFPSSYTLPPFLLVAHTLLNLLYDPLRNPRASAGPKLLYSSPPPPPPKKHG